MNEAKDEKAARICKKLGNAFFQEAKYTKAKEKYNHAVINSPLHTSDNLYALCISNRSAALFHLKEYELCIKDIEEALSYDIPEKIAMKLQQRRAKALLELGNSKEAITLLEDALGSCTLEENKQAINELIGDCRNIKKKDKVASKDVKKKSTDLYVSPLIEFKYNEKRGIHLVAKEDLKLGEYFIEEKPLLIVYESKNKSICINCGIRANVWYPCPTCSTDVYCSKQCSNENKFHSFECKLDLPEDVFSMQIKAAFRLLLKHENEIENLLSEKERNRSDLVNILPLSSDEISLSDILLLSKVEVKLIDFTKDILYKAQRVYLNNEDPRIHKLVTDLIKILQGNSFHRMKLVTRRMAFYFNLSFINHTCWPNSYMAPREFCDTRAYSIDLIKKGDEISFTYGGELFLLKNTLSRREYLKSNWNFICNCEYCCSDWSVGPERVIAWKCMKCSASLREIPTRGVVCTGCKFRMSEAKFDATLMALFNKNKSLFESMTEDDDVDRHALFLQTCTELMKNLCKPSGCYYHSTQLIGTFISKFVYN